MATINELIEEHTTLEVECLDRLYLNGYIPSLQTPGGLKAFLVGHRRRPVASPALLAQMTKDFVQRVEALINDHNLPVVYFQKGQRKDELAKEMRRKRPVRGGVVFVGVAQEKAQAFKGTKRKGPAEGLVDFDYGRQPVFVKHYYFYLDDEEFGESFIKVCTYFPFPLRICLNGHEWAKRQLQKQGIAFEALDNGFWQCQDPERLQRICHRLGPKEIVAFLHRWQKRLPFPLERRDRLAGYDYNLSIWQMEQSLTHIFRRPVHGREFFEEVIRENLDLGRPERVQLLFDRRIRRNTPGKFATGILTHGVHPSLHISYKSFDLKQYFKEGRGLRTESTINNTRDFGIGRSLKNLPFLQRLAGHINRRLLEVERTSQNCRFSQQSMQRLIEPTLTPEGQKAPGLKFGQPRVMALFMALCLFLTLPAGLRNRQLRQHVADLMGVEPDQYRPAQMTYDLKRLRLKGLITRREGTHAYFLTPYGRSTALFLSRLYNRVLRPGLSASIEPPSNVEPSHPLRETFETLNTQIDDMLEDAHMLN